MLIEDILIEADDKNRAPYGVIFDGDKKAFVGCAHEKAITMSKDVKDKLMALVKKYSIWYEGTGGDISAHKRFFGFGESGYKNSWDDAFERTIGGYPHQYLYTIMTNIEANDQLKILTKPDMTIYDSIMKAQQKVGYFQDNRKFSKSTLTRFLNAISSSKIDFVDLSQEPATKKNVQKFLTKGEKLMWPYDWEEYPHRAGKLSKLANDARADWLLKQKTGVYVMGAGMLIILKERRSKLKIVDGRLAAHGG